MVFFEEGSNSNLFPASLNFRDFFYLDIFRFMPGSWKVYLEIGLGLVLVPPSCEECRAFPRLEPPSTF